MWLVRFRKRVQKRFFAVARDLVKAGKRREWGFGERGISGWFYAIMKCGLETEVRDEDGHDIPRAYRVWGSFRSVI